MSKQVHNEPDCLALPRFERVKYFYGQLLGVREFQSEQSYFVDKHRLHNRYLHGYGVVCGLAVGPCHEPGTPIPQPHLPPLPVPHLPEQPVAAPPPSAAEPPVVLPPRPTPTPKPGPKPSPAPCEVCIEIDCGLALDCCGNEIAVSWPTQLDILARLSCDERAVFLHERKPAYISLCFVEKPLEPVRPLSADSCGGLVPDCVPSRLRDDFCIRVSLDCPAHDRSCSACARPCDDPCLLLARVEWLDGRVVIDNRVRRDLALFVPTKIEGVSWVHDGCYRPEAADHMLRHGLEIRFTDDVYTSTLRRGVIDVWVIQGGGGRHGDIYSADVHVVPGDPHAEFSRSVIVRLHGSRGDRLDPGDRLLIQLRSAFVLDHCCRAIDGDHIGGLVPQLDAHRDRPPSSRPPLTAPCARPEPRPLAPWTSGNGTPAGNFESWFYVGGDDDDHEQKRG